MQTLENLPQLKLGLIAVSRNNFSETLSEKTLSEVEAFCAEKKLPTVTCSVLVETEENVMEALEEAKKQGCNALAVLLGNFGQEGPETMLAQYFDGPVMYAGATEEDQTKLAYDGRRDAYCGMLNCSYNLNLRGVRAYIPENPIGTSSEIAEMIAAFLPIARAAVGLKSLKIIEFGPRPREFFACNAPINGLYQLGVEIEQNSELDLLLAYRNHANDPRIPEIVQEMKNELGDTQYEDSFEKFAQYELTLLDWAKEHRGARKYVAFANKCWPAFQLEFGFLPCYVHGRLMAKGIPVSCETDVYGALSEYIGLCVSGQSVAFLDINNLVPKDLYEAEIEGKYPYRYEDLFIGFHCGNAPTEIMAEHELKYKKNRREPHLPETGQELTRGTLEGPLKQGEVACYRLHAAPDGGLQAYIADGEILEVAAKTYGCHAIFNVSEMSRFYRHVLIEKNFPHHSAILYGEFAQHLYDLFRYLGIPYIGYNQPADERYETENPFRKKKRK